MGIFSRNKNLFKHRSGLTPTEINLLEDCGITVKDFISLFESICLSEIMKDNDAINQNGFIFSGIAIERSEFAKWKELLLSFNLDFQMSLNTISARYRMIKFDQYIGAEPILDVHKQLYKIRLLPGKDDFIEQMFYYTNDKSAIQEAYEIWKLKYNAIPIWADGSDNLLICENTDEKLTDSVFELIMKISPGNRESLEKGWQTVEDFKASIRNEFPQISLCFNG